MSETTPNLRLPYILPAQAQKHVTHNEALRALDAIVQIGVLSRSAANPPATPAEVARYIVASEAAGAWTGRAQQVAAFQDGAWAFYSPRGGWLAWVADENLLYAFDGSAWVRAGGALSLNPVPLVGVNATADSINRFVVSSDATLFNHAGGDHRHKINKARAGDTATLLFQTGFSGRAEIGLAGGDHLRIKVSSDGETWREAMTVDAASGRVSFPGSQPAEAFPSPWRGETWAALGGSHTQQGTYTQALAALLGCDLANLGTAGGRLSGPANGPGFEIMTQIPRIPANARLVTLEAGRADFQHATPLGTLEATSPTTFCGALHKAALDILSVDAKRTLVFITPLPFRTDAAAPGPDWLTPNGNGNSFFQFQEAVRAVARKVGCLVADVGGASGLTAASLAPDAGVVPLLGTNDAARIARFLQHRLQL